MKILLLQAVVSGIIMGLIYALVAAGLNLIFGLMNIVNFAHGEFLMIAMYLSFCFWLVGIDPLISLPLVAVVLGAAGALTYFGIVKRFLSSPMLVQICGTFGLAIALRGLAQFVWGPDFRTISAPLVDGRIQIGDLFIGRPQLVAAAICLATFVGLWLFISRTETGLALQATVQNRQAASVIGIPADRYYALGWAIGAGCAGIAGAALASFFYIFPDVGINFATLAFVAVALGGFGSVFGSLCAGLMIGVVESVGGVLLDPSYKLLLIYLLFFGVMLIKPEGLWGVKA